MDKIVITGLEFHGHCGVSEEERAAGQRLSVDLELFCDLERAMKSDSLTDTIDYDALCRRIVEIGRSERFHLLETLAGKVTGVLLDEFAVSEVIVRVKKPQPPVESIRNSFAVEIRRKKQP